MDEIDIDAADDFVKELEINNNEEKEKSRNRELVKGKNNEEKVSINTELLEEGNNKEKKLSKTELAGGKKVVCIVGSDKLVGCFDEQDTDLIIIEVDSGTAKPLLHKLRKHIDTLDEKCIPVVVVCVGTYDISAIKYGVRKIQHEIASGRKDAFITAAVHEVISLFESFTRYIVGKGGLVSYALVTPLQSQLCPKISMNPPNVQETLSDVYMVMNQRIKQLNWLVTPLINKSLEFHGNKKQHLIKGRNQPKIVATSFTDEGYPKPENQMKMRRECHRALNMMANWKTHFNKQK